MIDVTNGDMVVQTERERAILTIRDVGDGSPQTITMREGELAWLINALRHAHRDIRDMRQMDKGETND